ncbi:MFS transporter [Indioceanicola profundi]|uniref:MFS transporter n=1 Tax=Indioceanicola profundi TaxID=2220096 RepID=UPI000E6ADCF4|nr:MFS transporter [Indioceanicola profundi]
MNSALIRPVLVLYLAVFMLMAGAGTLTTVLGVRLADATMTTLTIGSVMAAYSAGLTLGSLTAFRMILRVGHIRAFSALSSILSAATLLHGLGVDPIFWALLRLAAGYCMAGLFVCVESWLNQNATPASRGQILAFYMISLYGGQGVGQFLLNVGAEQPFLIFVLISIILSLALVPVALTRQAPPQLPRISSFSVARLWRASPLGLLGVVLAGLVGGALFALAPVYLRQLGYGVAETAMFMSATILGGVALQWPLGRLSDLFDRRTVIVGLFILLALTGSFLAFAGPLDLVLLVAGAALFGGVTFTLYPVCVAHTNDFLSPDDIVSASGGLVLGYSMGATLGPFIASAAMELGGPSGLFLFAGVVGAIGASFGLARMLARPAIPNDQQGSFTAMPGTTPVAVPLNPRTPEEAVGTS